MAKTCLGIFGIASPYLFHHYGPQEVSDASTSQAQVARGNSSIPHVLNKYNIVFVDAEHARRYDAIVSRKICAPNYLDVKMLTTLYLYDDLLILLRNFSWENFVAL